MKKTTMFLASILCFAGLFIILSCSTIENGNEKVIVGERSWYDWNLESGWDLKSYYAEQPDTNKAKLLHDLVIKNDISFLVFASSFCDDCREELPRIMRILHKTQIPIERIRLVGLDRDMRDSTGESRQYNFKRLPLVVIKKQNKDFNTITFSQKKKDWLNEMIEILK